MEQFEKIREHLRPELRALNEIITDTLRTGNEMMNNIVTGYLEKKGKQIRPILVILSAKMFGEVNEDVLHAGAALEMLHNASLIHDDVVDETELRRGEATINNIWGNHVAVLVGDFFVSNALAAGIKTGHLSIISALSALGKELSLGEIDQITNAREHHFDEAGYFMVIRKKTASLFMHCVKMGADAVNAPAEDVAPLVTYAELLGLCFQIKDDIFDYYDNPQIGKPTGNDLREGKVTLPLLYALNHGDQEDAEEMRELIKKGDLSFEEINRLIEFAKLEGGIDYAYDVMRKMQQEADTIIDRYPDSTSKKAFKEIFEFIISRDR